MHTFRYRTAATSVKLTATAFLLLTVAGLGIAALQIYSRTGLTAHGALLHYRGDEATLQYPKSFNEMVEITHAHAFTMPLLALILSVAILISTAPERLKRLVVVALFGGMVLELALPWLIRYGPPWTVHLLPVAGALLGGGLLTAVARPLYEMWGSHRRPDHGRPSG
jgi:uncharacterized membrane protein